MAHYSEFWKYRSYFHFHSNTIIITELRSKYIQCDVNCESIFREILTQFDHGIGFLIPSLNST